MHGLSYLILMLLLHRGSLHLSVWALCTSTFSKRTLREHRNPICWAQQFSSMMHNTATAVVVTVVSHMICRVGKRFVATGPCGCCACILRSTWEVALPHPTRNQTEATCCSPSRTRVYLTLKSVWCSGIKVISIVVHPTNQCWHVIYGFLKEQQQQHSQQDFIFWEKPGNLEC